MSETTCKCNCTECKRNAAIAKQWFERTYGPITEEGQRWIDEMKEQTKHDSIPRRQL